MKVTICQRKNILKSSNGRINRQPWELVEQIGGNLCNRILVIYQKMKINIDFTTMFGTSA
ncbi:hypothetical protein Avbf_16359 [Armadillidium vulgare]|nr:hypothetical protein Avbf_16359 [Armadillidium vulgare]